MSERRSRQIIVIAIAISLLAHALLAGWLRLPLPAFGDRERMTSSLARVRISHVVHVRTTPSPRPHVAAGKTPTHTRVAHVTLVQTHATRGTQPVAVAVAPAVAVPTPGARPSSGAPCHDPNAQAAVASPAPPPDIPADVRATATAGITAVLVHLDSAADVIDAAVQQSSGSAGLDQIALDQARAATYAPALHACKPIAGAYTYRVKWAPW